MVRTIEGGLARRLGIKANDILLAVDGVKAKGSKSKDIVDRIKGSAGTSVTLQLMRKGTAIEMTVPRERVDMEHVEVKVRELAGSKYLSVKLGSFMDANGCAKISKKFTEAEKANPDLVGIVLDLRDNGGDLLKEGICIGGLFLRRKVIVQVKDLNRNGLQLRISYREQITQLPMVTLLNRNSASASEVVSGALQDYQRSWIVGERSFGKATVQAPMELTDDILLYRTIQRFYQPSGRTNQIVGILPDFETPAKPGMSEDERFVLREGDLYPNAMSALAHRGNSHGPPMCSPLNGVVSNINGLKNRL